MSPSPPWTGWARVSPPPPIVILIYPPPRLHWSYVEMDLALYQGSKLVVKFYSWLNEYEGENVIENFTPPWHVKGYEMVLHPENNNVRRARLDLTYDNTENVIGTLATFILTRDILYGIQTEIYLEWPFATPEERNELFAEISDIYLKWPFAPT